MDFSSEVGVGAPKGENCTVLLTDIVGSTAAHRTAADRRTIREAIYEIVPAAVEKAGIPWNECHHEGRGDGILVVFPSTVPTKQVVHLVHAYVTDGLRRHNATARRGARFKQRNAVDVGSVESDTAGVDGRVISNAARLIDQRTFRRRLAAASFANPVGLIVSDHVYLDSIKPYPESVPSAEYKKINGRVKEYEFTAWFHVAPGDGLARRLTGRTRRAGVHRRHRDARHGGAGGPVAWWCRLLRVWRSRGRIQE